jgi:uncharacterized protein (TIGR02646 family)
MRNIHKNPEPTSLTQHRCNTNTGYDNYAEKDDLRESLVNEQRGICCYCMQRIYPNLEHMKIEHNRSQSPNKFPQKQLDYGNLLGACLGGTGKPRRDQHCDTRKGDDDISFNPADPANNVERLFKFPGSGRIEANDPQLQSEIDNILNLNHPRLVNNRKAMIDSFTQLLRSGKARNVDFSKHLANWEGKDGGQLDPFCQVIVYYLRKKIAKMP